MTTVHSADRNRTGRRDDGPATYTVGEVAAMFRVQPRTVSRHPDLWGGVRVGRRWRFPSRHVDRMLARREADR